MMRHQNTPNYGFLIDVVDDKGRVRWCYVIEQVVPTKGKGGRGESAREAVRHRLRQVTSRQGILHVIADEGPLEELRDRIERMNVHPV